jgi:hypothetical protein
MDKTDLQKNLIDIRKNYIKSVKSLLLGPGSEFSVPDPEHELISSSPVLRYSIGILYPQECFMNQDNDEMIPVYDEEKDFGEETELEEEDDDDELQEDEGLLGNADYERHNTPPDSDTGNIDEEISLATQYMPSSIGVTFMAKGNTDLVRGFAQFATYRKAEIEDCVIPVDDDNFMVPDEFTDKIAFDKEKKVLRLKSKIEPKELKDIFGTERELSEELKNFKKYAYRFVTLCYRGFVRIPHRIHFELDFSNSNYVENHNGLDDVNVKITALRIDIAEDVWSLTIMLVNNHIRVRPNYNYCLFQPTITVSTDNNEFVFVENKSNKNIISADEEDLINELLYRNKKSFGKGLGVAVNWNIGEDGKGSIWSDYVPEFEVPPMNFNLPENSAISKKQLSMKYLSDISTYQKHEKIESLKKFVGLYETWIKKIEEDSAGLEDSYLLIAKKNIENCKKVCKRMFSGIKILEEDDNAYKAFCFANRAMFMQRVQLRLQAKMADAERYPDDLEISECLKNIRFEDEDDDNCIWRPFQIAFILMDIESIVKDDSHDRDIVDLIWFPTGGGKTEAYLGLTAFTIFYRRIVYPDTYDGTTVIMRYTLRLLTAQQFTRAATLICACEYIRRRNEDLLGEKPITIGLWIGGEHTPNRNDDAKVYLKKLQEATITNLKYTLDKNNKFQVLKCPWCGTKLIKGIKRINDETSTLIGSWGYALKDNKHFYIYCTHEDCEFNGILPIQIVDEELYKYPPTLLFATVDKFAMLPWNGDIASFFAINSGNRSPELIIQDELHLISGSLGTIVGLYETAIDELCKIKKISPKIIASTATIRRAKEQSSALYNREVMQFPPPGIDADDSFFAQTSQIDYKNGIFGRIYIGLMPSGKTKAIMEARVMATLLLLSHMINLDYLKEDDMFVLKDKFWTLTAYFNSLKDLGKASTLVNDDVKDFIRRIAYRFFTKPRIILSPDELTSRVTTMILNETLDKLEKLEYSRVNIDNKRYASNILLATNMISVGIDISRLNLMLMVGQPKLTSEYIQASSRIGRSYPGIVFVQYDATKSRDRSHYEEFKSYHESFYRYVEPTSVTPFSKPACERALHAVIVTLVRYYQDLLKDDCAQFADLSDENIEKVKAVILERVKKINNRSKGKLKYDIDEIEANSNHFISFWREKIAESKNESKKLFFGRKFIIKNSLSTGEMRLLKPFESKDYDQSKETLTSMRNVDSLLKGKIITGR